MREALSQSRQEGTGSIGWPVSVFQGTEGPTCLPALLVPVTWRLSLDTLSLTPDQVPPSINPAWMREVRRRTARTEDDLREALFQGEDGPAFGDIADRLGHAVARLAAERLRPADLNTELRLDQDAIYNTAAFFLPGEATFTRAVAADLDRIAGLPGPGPAPRARWARTPARPPGKSPCTTRWPTTRARSRCWATISCR